MGYASSESALVVCVRELRRALGDTRRLPRFIETVHGRGYRFLASVQKMTSSLYPLDSASRTSSAPITSTFVGREAELAYLHRLFEKAQQGERQLVFVTGE